MEDLFNYNLYDTKLENQILFMKKLNSIITTPITVSILNSLTELKGIKKGKIK